MFEYVFQYEIKPNLTFNIIQATHVFSHREVCFTEFAILYDLRNNSNLAQRTIEVTS